MAFLVLMGASLAPKITAKNGPKNGSSKKHAWGLKKHAWGSKRHAVAAGKLKGEGGGFELRGILAAHLYINWGPGRSPGGKNII